MRNAQYVQDRNTKAEALREGNTYDFPELTWEDVVLHITLHYSGYVVNPEMPNSILNEPIGIIKRLYQWILWKEETELYNSLMLSAMRM